jgi:hypothetical protein
VASVPGSACPLVDACLDPYPSSDPLQPQLHNKRPHLLLSLGTPSAQPPDNSTPTTTTTAAAYPPSHSNSHSHPMEGEETQPPQAVALPSFWVLDLPPLLPAALEQTCSAPGDAMVAADASPSASPSPPMLLLHLLLRPSRAAGSSMAGSGRAVPYPQHDACVSKEESAWQGYGAGGGWGYGSEGLEEEMLVSQLPVLLLPHEMGVEMNRVLDAMLAQVRDGSWAGIVGDEWVTMNGILHLRSASLPHSCWVTGTLIYAFLIVLIIKLLLLVPYREICIFSHFSSQYSFTLSAMVASLSL